MPIIKVTRRGLLCATGATLTALPASTATDNMPGYGTFDLALTVDGEPLLVTAETGALRPLFVR